MKSKRCIVYHRFSDDDQSNSSVERQEVITTNWCRNNDIVILDSLKDEGYTARNFDRPDIKKLFDFISNNHKTIHYLVVSDLTRFSRELGDAVNMVKKIQRGYGIKIVSAYRSAIYDVTDHASYFMMSLEFLLGETENIKRAGDINGGIYAAKKQERRYLGAAPYGYKNIIDERFADRQHPNGKPGIAPNEQTAPIVRYIFEAFLHGTPLNEIFKQAKQLGFKQNGNSAAQRILTNKVYIGLLHVKAYKDFEEEWVQGVHEPLVARSTFFAVQDKMKKGKPIQIISDAMPLRGVLKCWCNSPLTGAPSKSRNGGWYYYYKCKFSKHNNISAIKAHMQLNEIWQYLSLPAHIITAIKETSAQLLEERLKENDSDRKTVYFTMKDLQNQLTSIEEKWIKNQIAFETYQRWYPDLTKQVAIQKQKLEQLNRSKEENFLLLQTELHKLADLQYFYNCATTMQKQQMINLVFDRSLYYRQGSYRTAYIIPLFTSNTMILKEKGLLEIDGNQKIYEISPSSGAGGAPIELPVIQILAFLKSIHAA